MGHSHKLLTSCVQPLLESGGQVCFIVARSCRNADLSNALLEAHAASSLTAKGDKKPVRMWEHTVFCTPLCKTEF